MYDLSTSGATDANSPLRKRVMIHCHSPRLGPKEMRKYWYVMEITNPVYFKLLVVSPTYVIVPGI